MLSDPLLSLQISVGQPIVHRVGQNQLDNPAPVVIGIRRIALS